LNQRLFSHFHFFQFSDHYWKLDSKERQEIHKNLLNDLEDENIKSYLYQVFPMRSDVDFILWSTTSISAEKMIAEYFKSRSIIFNKYRQNLLSKESWWGLTRPSDYARGKSSQEIDPFEGNRSSYLIVYPFSKTPNWYKIGRDSRQGMMNEHIRIGHQYPEIKQLLLYSTGLQDQEFIVTYETEDIAQFSQLVTDLRSSEARLYTEKDTPIFTALYHTPEETLRLFL